MTDLSSDHRPASYTPPLTWPSPPDAVAEGRATGGDGAQQPPVGGDEGTPRGSAWRNAAVSAVVAAVVAAGVAVPVTLAVSQDAPATATAGEATGGSTVPTSSAPAGEALTVAEVADRVAPSVARVDVQTPTGQASGSAVVYREDGYLLTNAHVVAGAAEVFVTLPEGTRIPAEVVGGDAQSDLAVLRLRAADLPPGGLPAADIATTEARVGETAIAIGSPFELDGSVTAGIVSGLGRSLPGSGLGGLLQTDAPINPGNSGGALVNDRAEVIGINTAILGSGGGGGRGGNIGIGFAIPIATATHLADQLITDGFIRYAQLGVQGQDVDPRVAELYGLSVRDGALIAEVGPGAAADDAGLLRGDIITAVDDEAVASMADLAAQVRRHSPGDEISLTVVRGGEERRIDVTLGESTPAPGLGDVPG
jgi:S1-C subfamily serine protease